MLTFGQLFGVVKSEGLNLCNELKLQAKYGADKAHVRTEMGNFCEAFGIEKIEAPSKRKKRIIKRKGPAKRPFRPRPVAKPSPPAAKPRPKGKAPKKQSKKPIVCFKCGKPGHKSFQCKMEQKINELFSENPELKQKIHALLINNQSKEEPDDYYSDSTDSEYESSPIRTINVITNKSQEEFLLDLIRQIPDGTMKKEYLEKLKQLILEEEDKSLKFSLNASTSSLTNIYKQFPIPNPF